MRGTRTVTWPTGAERCQRVPVALACNRQHLSQKRSPLQSTHWATAAASSQMHIGSPSADDAASAAVAAAAVAVCTASSSSKLVGSWYTPPWATGATAKKKRERKRNKKKKEKKEKKKEKERKKEKIKKKKKKKKKKNK